MRRNPGLRTVVLIVLALLWLLGLGSGTAYGGEAFFSIYLGLTLVGLTIAAVVVVDRLRAMLTARRAARQRNGHQQKEEQQ